MTSGSGVSSDGMLNIDPWVKFRPICSCVLSHVPVSRLEDTPECVAARCAGPPGQACSPPVAVSRLFRQSFKALRGSHEWATSFMNVLRYNIPHIPYKALLFAGCHFFSKFFFASIFHPQSIFLRIFGRIFPIPLSMTLPLVNNIILYDRTHSVFFYCYRRYRHFIILLFAAYPPA